MTGSRNPRVALGTAAFFLLLGALALVGRADSAPTAKEHLLGLESVCADQTELLYAANVPARRVLGRWVTIEGPTFGLQPGAPRPGLKAHAVDPSDPRRMFASDGRSIQRSTDGGCAWTEVHQVVTTEVPGAADVEDLITQMAVSGTRVWALIAPPPEKVGQVRIVVSDDRGDTWHERSTGLPLAYTRADGAQVSCGAAVCHRSVLAVSSSDSNHAYVGLSRYGVEPPLYATTDGGRTWQTRGFPSVQCCLGTFTDMAVDPANPLSVWTIKNGQLSHTTDGGTTWEALDEDEIGYRRAAGLRLTRHEGRSHVQVLLASREDVGNGVAYDEVATSEDGGTTFEFLPLDKPIRREPFVSGGGDPSELIVATVNSEEALYIELGEDIASVWELRDSQLGVLHFPQGDSTSEVAHWFRGYAGMAAFIPGPLPENRFPADVGKAQFDPVAAARASVGRVPGALTPAHFDAELGAAGTRRVDYRLDLPALPTPVDIWFLIDTSGSMAGAIEGLQTGMQTIIDELRASKIDAWFGVAAFPAGPIPYDRFADLAPPNTGLYEAIDRLNTEGGGWEIHPTALYQSVTGRGQPDAGLEPGRGASFRPQALKIIVHATDEAYGYDPSGPTEEEAADAMVAAGVRHVGLDLAAGVPDPLAGTDGVRPRSTKTGHDNMARATGTFAPVEGVDCNGDGITELKQGDPITCPILRGKDSVEIAPAIISAVRAIRDETQVGLQVVQSGGIQVRIEGATRSPVNVKVANSLPFEVTFTCPPESTGRVADVTLLATVRGAPSAEAKARIGCGQLPALITPPPAPEPRGAVVPMVLAPPQLVPDLEPGLSPLNQTAPAQVGQPNPQPGMAAQPGEVATAKQRAGRDGPPPPSASEGGDGRERNSAPATTGTLGAGASLAVALGGWAVRRQRTPAFARGSVA